MATTEEDHASTMAAASVPVKRPGRSPTDDDRSREHYDDIKRENPLFIDYYRRQSLVPIDEWDQLMNVLASPLPTTFRLTGHRWEESQITRQQFSQLATPLGDRVKPLLWYQPEGIAWHLDLDRKSLRTDEKHGALHSWLVAASENGDISRQEAVSMIPPLLLDVQADHLVLDMCAAPGSKTAQLVEQMHMATAGKAQQPTGLVIANDADQQRAYMLYHQVKRILSPCLLVTNNDGTTFPNLVETGSTGEFQRTQFDRILADVPCSGDGTLRKNALLWKTWTPNHAFGLHPLQVRLLDKAVKLLKVGGRMVYSTCSMNFVENEAVVACILSRYPNSLRLVDVSDRLKGLKRAPGRSTWKIINKDGQEYGTPADVPPELSRRFPASLFPQESYYSLGLGRCLRIYPHMQNTGGFFVALIEKTADLANRPIGDVNEKDVSDVQHAEAQEVQDVSRVSLPPRPKFGKKNFFKPPSDGEFRRLDVSTDPTLRNIFDWYGIDVSQIVQSGYGFFVRSDRSPYKSIIVVSPQGHRLLSSSSPDQLVCQDASNRRLCNASLKIVNAGVRAFEIYESGSRVVAVACPYRLLFESVNVIRPFISKRTHGIERSLMRTLLGTNDSVRIPELEESLGQGGAILETTIEEGIEGSSSISIMAPVWISERGIKAFVAQANKPALLKLLEYQI